jgi:putative oxidoreductase
MKPSAMTLPKPSKGLTITLWIVQVILAGMFIMAGVMKSFTPIAELGAKMPWVNELPNLVRFIGVSELLGGLGLLIPALTRIKPVLTPIAALGLGIIMIFATVYHLSKGEMPAIGFTIILAALAFFVAWGRFRKAPIQSR